jgi:HD-GYP domain-containing protein (c-di-GMP phosphodiesterase class II)
MGRGAPACRIYGTILSRISAFAELGRIAGAHHERLDGGGYPRGLKADQIDLETRIITTADIFDAITAERPYRGAIPVPQALEMMEKTVGTALDPDCFAALRRAVAQAGLMEAPLSST